MDSGYISLQEATKYCHYSQEYLGLRARQGKLKAVKFGRNWVTKREWLEEYLKKTEKYNNNFKAQKIAVPPGNLPVEEGSFFSTFATLLRGSPIEKPVPVVRFGFITALVFVLATAGCVFGKESFKNVYQELNPIVIEFNENFDFHFTTLVSEFNENFDKGMAGLAKDVSSFTYIVGGVGDIIVEKTIEVLADTISDIPQSLVTVSKDLEKTNLGVAEVGVGISEWFSSQTKEIALGISTIPEIFEETYFTANELVEEKISTFEKQIKESGRGIVETIKGIPEAVTRPVKEKIVVEKVTPEITEKEIEELRAEIKKLKEEGLPAKEIIKEIEVSRITKVEPIKEITKETIITKIDEEELAQLKTQIAELNLWGTDIEGLREITKKLQAAPTYVTAPTAPIYIASQGLQVGGAGTFASLGVSGPAGIGNLGVGGSVSLGSIPSDRLTVKATSIFEAPVTAEGGLTVGTGTLSIDNQGNLTTTGNINTTGTGNLTVAGDLAVTGTPIFTGDLTTAGNLIFDLANDVTIQATDPAAARTYTIPDFGADDTFVGLATTQALTNKTYEGLTITTTTGILTISGGKTLTVSASTTLAADSITFEGGETLTLTAAKDVTFADAFSTSGAFALTLTTTGITDVILPTTGTLEVTGHTHALAAGATDVTATAAELNLLDLASLSVGQVLRATGASAAGWGAIQDSDLPSALTGKTYDGLTLTAVADGFEVSGGTSSRKLTVTASDVTLKGGGHTLDLGANLTTTTGAITLAGNVAGSSVTLPTTGTLEVTGHTHALAAGATDVTATAAELNLLDLASLSVGQVLRATGASAAGWGAIQDSDLPSALTGKTYDGLTISTGSDTFTLTKDSSTLTRSGAHTLTLTTTGITDVTLPTTGTLAVTGHAHAAADITSGAFGVTRGGTGLSAIAAGGILYASGADALSRIAPTGANQVLRSTGANALEISSLVADDIPNLDVAKITSGRFGMTQMPAGTSGQVLTAQGAGVDPAYAAAPGGGLAIFGDGNDGDVTLSGNKTLDRDYFYGDLNTNGYTVYTNGYRLFVKGTLTNTGTITRNGNNGGNGGNATSGSAGGAGSAAAALTAGSLGGSPAGVVGAVGVSQPTSNGLIGNPGNSGNGADPALGGDGGDGGNGGSMTGISWLGGDGGLKGTATEPTAAKGGFRAPPFAVILKEIETTVVKIEGGGSGGSGGSGAVFNNTGNRARSGGGGGSASGGGVIFIAAKTINNSGGTISANGGTGGNGGNGWVNNTPAENEAGCGGGGGAGGGGGLLILIYNSLTTGTEQANGGSGGGGGTSVRHYQSGSWNVSNGSNGNNGSNGTVIKIANQ